MADQKQAPDFEVTRMRRIQAVSMSLENRPRASERPGRPGKVARDERDLGFGDDAARPRHCLSWTEGAGGHLEESPCANEITQLRHRDAAQRKRGPIVA